MGSKTEVIVDDICNLKISDHQYVYDGKFENRVVLWLSDQNGGEHSITIKLNNGANVKLDLSNISNIARSIDVVPEEIPF